MELLTRFGLAKTLDTAEWYDIFTADGTWDWAARGSPALVDVLVVAHGGTADEIRMYGGGSGGAGGVRLETGVSVAGDTTVTIGDRAGSQNPTAFGGIAATEGGRWGRPGGSGGADAAGTPGEGHDGQSNATGGGGGATAPGGPRSDQALGTGVVLRALGIPHSPINLGLPNAVAAGGKTVSGASLPYLGNNDPTTSASGIGSGGGRAASGSPLEGTPGVVIVMNHRPRPAATGAVLFLHAAAPHVDPRGDGRGEPMPSQRIGAGVYNFTYMGIGEPRSLLHDTQNYLFFAGNTAANNLTVPTPGTGTRYWVADFLDRTQATGSSTANAFAWGANSGDFSGHKLTRMRIYQDAAHQNLLADFNANLTREPFNEYTDPQGNTWTMERLAGAPVGGSQPPLTLVDRSAILQRGAYRDRLELSSGNGDFNVGAGETLTAVVALRAWSSLPQPIITKKAATGAGWELALTGSGNPSVTINGGTANANLVSGRSLPIGVATVIAATFTDANISVKVAHDAAAANTTTHNQGAASNSRPVLIGRRDTPGDTSTFRGEIFGVALFDREVTQLELNQIAKEYGVGAAALPPANMTWQGFAHYGTSAYAELQTPASSLARVQVFTEGATEGAPFTRASVAELPAGAEGYNPPTYVDAGGNRPRIWVGAHTRVNAVMFEPARTNLTGNSEKAASTLVGSVTTITNQVADGGREVKFSTPGNGDLRVTFLAATINTSSDITISLDLRINQASRPVFLFLGGNAVSGQPAMIRVNSNGAAPIILGSGVTAEHYTNRDGFTRYVVSIPAALLNGSGTTLQPFIAKNYGDAGTWHYTAARLQTEQAAAGSSYIHTPTTSTEARALERLAIPVEIDWDAGPLVWTFALRHRAATGGNWKEAIGLYAGNARRIRVQNSSSDDLRFVIPAGGSERQQVIPGFEASTWNVYSLIMDKANSRMTPVVNGATLDPIDGIPTPDFPIDIDNVLTLGDNHIMHAAYSGNRLPLLGLEKHLTAPLSTLHAEWLIGLDNLDIRL